VIIPACAVPAVSEKVRASPRGIARPGSTPRVAAQRLRPFYGFGLIRYFSPVACLP
jgi:hypothetical protein